MCVCVRGRARTYVCTYVQESTLRLSRDGKSVGGDEAKGERVVSSTSAGVVGGGGKLSPDEEERRKMAAEETVS